MKKFNYALLVLVFGFAMCAGFVNLSYSLTSTAFAHNDGNSQWSEDAADHDNDLSFNDSHDNDSHENDSNDDHDSDYHDSNDNDSHENDSHDNDDCGGISVSNFNNSNHGDDDCVPPVTDVCPNLPGNQTEVPAGKHLVDGQCVPNTPPPSTATISAVKIVCDSETDLPNWGIGGPDVTSSTASNFLSAHSNCHQANWTFEWAPDGQANPGDEAITGGSGWTSFSTTATVSAGALIWVREQFDNDYIPFSGDTTEPRNQNVSAEFYCNADVLNYDNYDFINPVIAGQTYNCVGFNVLVAQPENTAPTANAGVDQAITLPTNSVTLDGSASSDSDGTIASYAWSFVSGPSNIDPADSVSPNVAGLVAGTYVFKLIVTDNDGATGEDTVSITVNPAGVNPQCGDGVDNSDEEDTLADANDPGCHSDGNANNTGSYVSTDNDETDVPACSNTGDDDGDELVDSADPGCHSDGNANNSETYNPNDNDENVVVENTLPQCGDSIDNDGDGQIDFLGGDPGCNSNIDNDETDIGGGGGGSSSGNRLTGTVLGAQTTCGIYVDKFLRRGYKNNVEAVKKVQIFLNDYTHAGLVVDGIYGSKTEAALKAFQVARKDNILTPWGINAPTGIFYLTTQTEVNNIMCPTLNLAIPSNLVNFTPNVI